MGTFLISVIFLPGIHFQSIHHKKFRHILIQSGFFLLIHHSLIQIRFGLIHKVHRYIQ